MTQHKQSSHRASASFSRAQIEALAFALRGLREGKDLRIFARASKAQLLELERHAIRMLGSMAERAHDDSAAPAAMQERAYSNGESETANDDQTASVRALAD
jgi:hypothetical protein